MKRHFSTILKGIWIGGTLTLPGVSGGSMAMILGIYEPLIGSVNALIGRKGDRRKAAKFLALFTVSALMGIFALSGSVVWALDRFSTPVLFLFSGIIAGGLPLLLSEIKSSSLHWYHLLNLMLGIILVVALSYFPTDPVAVDENSAVVYFLMQVISGIVAAVALVLPGISVSHMLYVLGAYEGVMSAISTLDFLMLLPFAVGVLLGILLSAKLIAAMLERFRSGTYMLIFGFVLGSVFELMNDVAVESISVLCLLLFFAGFFAMFLLFSKKKADA